MTTAVDVNKSLEWVKLPFFLYTCASVNGLLSVLTLGCAFLALIPQYSDSPSTADAIYWRGIHSIVQHVNSNVNMQFF